MKNIPVRHIRSTTEESAFSENFNIRNIQDLFAGKDLVQELHRHNFFYLLVLEKGSGTHEIDFVSYPVGNQTVFLMRPGQVHQLCLHADSTGFLIQCGAHLFNHELVSQQFVRRVSSANYFQLEDGSFKKLFAILTSIFLENTNKKEGYQEMIVAHLHIFLIELMRHLGKAPANRATLYQQERLDEFSALLEINIATCKQVSQYADMLHLTPYQLNAITKATLGKTSSALISEHIILEAKRILLATSHQITQIADQLGYDDVSYFIRFFKKHTGLSPDAFRQNFR